MKRHLIVLVVLMLGAATIYPLVAQNDNVGGTMQSSEATVESLAWMAGHWVGKGFGAECEEVWSPPSAGTMVGTFKLYDADGVKFYEIMTIAPDSAGQIILKVKHFNADLTGWEEKDKFAEFPLTAVRETMAQFSGLKYDRLSEDSLQITVTVSHKDGTTSEEVISCALKR